MPSNFDSSKGTPIQIVGGDHSGCSGWIDKSRHPTNCFTPVILNKKKHNRLQEIQTKVQHENYILHTELKPPTSYEDAMLQQHTDINELLNKLVREMAQCELTGANETSQKNISSIFLSRLHKARQRQDVKGSKARWRKIKFGSNA
jgi:hypothetical protein